MDPKESSPPGGCSIETMADTTNTVGVNQPNFETMADIEQAVKTETSPNGVSSDEACNKTLEDNTNGETESTVEVNGEDRSGELSNSSDIRSLEVAENSEVNADSQAHDYESADSVGPEPVIHASDLIRNRSDMEVHYDMDDPLEFARQVAIEVEREVEDCREESSSSSSSDEAHESISQLPGNPANEPESGTHGQEPQTENPDEPGNCATQEIESSQVTNVNRALSVDAEKSFSDFDLNEEICMEKMDDVENQISTPIAFNSASIAATSSKMAESPFQFYGNHGWKGSSATSAFHSVNGTNNSSKQHKHCLDIDLNIHESFDEEPYVESTTERPNLDLNCVTDDDIHVEEQIHHLSNGYNNFSSSSSSSSKQPPKFRTIDLNDRPSLDSMISIMGVKVEVNKSNAMSNNSNSNSYPFLNVWDPMPAAPYVYTGPTSATGGAIMSSSLMYGQYGQFGYMLDSVGDPVVIPQAQPSFHYDPHLMMPGSNGVGPTVFGLDLNAGSSSSNLVGGKMKRREPESGWELELFPFKHHQTTWK